MSGSPPIAAAFLALAVWLLPPAADLVPKTILLEGRITAIDEEKKVVTFKAGSKSIEIDYTEARGHQHAVEPLSAIPAGSTMHAFARRTLMSRDLYYLEQFVVLVAGPLQYPPYEERNPEKPHWETGFLRISEDKNTMWIEDARLHCGKERPTCVIRAAKLNDFYELDKKGRIVGKPIFIRGSMKTEMKDGKAVERFIASHLILPATGLPKAEYNYILRPELLNEEQAAGKR